jgi:uracil-DNA glycosylase
MPKIAIVGEAWGAEEDRVRAAFVGASGIELIRMLGEAKILELTDADFDLIRRYWKFRDPSFVKMLWNLHTHEIFRTNVFNFRPPENKIDFVLGPKTMALPGYPPLIKGADNKYVRKEFAPELDRLGEEILQCDPNIIILCGNTPFWAMCGKISISRFRGTTLLSSHTVSRYKVLPIYHPAYILRQWDQRPTTVIDLIKAERESHSPDLIRPIREIWIEPCIEDIERFYHEHILQAKKLGREISVDVETNGDRITHIGFAVSSALAIVIPFDDRRRANKSYFATANDERKVWRIIRKICEDPEIEKTYQNGLYDIAFGWRSYGVRTLGAAEDTMLMHHALQPESLKALGFLGSIYTDEGAWKNIREKKTTIKRDD